jgi:hypothetical protein
MKVWDDVQYLDERILVHRHSFVVHSLHVAWANEYARLSFDNNVAIIEMFDNKLCPTESFHKLHLRTPSLSV